MTEGLQALLALHCPHDNVGLATTFFGHDLLRPTEKKTCIKIKKDSLHAETTPTCKKNVFVCEIRVKQKKE